MRCQHFPASLGLPRYLFLLHRGVTGIWALITAILVGGDWVREEIPEKQMAEEGAGACVRTEVQDLASAATAQAGGQGTKGGRQEHSCRGWPSTHKLTFLNRSGEEKKQLCLVSGLESHWTLLRNFSCHWWSAGAESLGYGNPVWTVASWKSDLHSIIPMG